MTDPEYDGPPLRLHTPVLKTIENRLAENCLFSFQETINGEITVAAALNVSRMFRSVNDVLWVVSTPVYWDCRQLLEEQYA